MSRILIAGCGYVGSALGRALVDDSDSVWGLRRHVASLPPGVQSFEADLAVPGSLRELPAELDAVVYAASPGGSDEALYRTAYVVGLRNLIAALYEQGQRPRTLVFVSSTSVYAQSRGEWVDEDSPTEPVGFPGRLLLEAEDLVHESPLPATVLRLGGIYGPRRTRLVEKVRQGHAVYGRATPHYTNRIHRDDCAGVLRHLLHLESPEPLYLGVDSDPAEDATVLRWLAGTLGAPEPRPATKPEEADRERLRGNKRCRNARLLGSGYAFRYPTFREGYTAVLAGQS